jgi:hypothetical protein
MPWIVCGLVAVVLRVWLVADWTLGVVCGGGYEVLDVAVDISVGERQAGVSLRPEKACFEDMMAIVAIDLARVLAFLVVVELTIWNHTKWTLWMFCFKQRQRQGCAMTFFKTPCNWC